MTFIVWSLENVLRAFLLTFEVDGCGLYSYAERLP
jgi:hypothetical protein